MLSATFSPCGYTICYENQEKLSARISISSLFEEFILKILKNAGHTSVRALIELSVFYFRCDSAFAWRSRVTQISNGCD